MVSSWVHVRRWRAATFSVVPRCDTQQLLPSKPIRIAGPCQCMAQRDLCLMPLPRQ